MPQLQEDLESWNNVSYAPNPTFLNDTLIRHFLVMRPCSHVLCKTCTDTLAIPNKQCVTCDAVLPTSKDVIQLSREGTGFSGGGRAETKKVGVSFQG